MEDWSVSVVESWFESMLKKIIFNNSENPTTLHTTHHNTNQWSHILQDRKTIHTQVVSEHLKTVSNSSILN